MMTVMAVVVVVVVMLMMTMAMMMMMMMMIVMVMMHAFFSFSQLLASTRSMSLQTLRPKTVTQTTTGDVVDDDEHDDTGVCDDVYRVVDYMGSGSLGRGENAK